MGELNEGDLPLRVSGAKARDPILCRAVKSSVLAKRTVAAAG